jgi:hypothetical protein
MVRGLLMSWLAALGATLALGMASWAESRQSSGTGFFVDRGGWILTNAHVVEGCARVEVVGHGAPMELVRDRRNDLAALRVAPVGVEPLAFRLLSVRLAEAVHALGYPLGDVLSDSVKVTSGSVSSLAGAANDDRYLQVSAPVQPGNSGGPLIDDAGFVVGIVTAQLDPELFAGVQNVNFALRAALATAFLSAHRVPFEERAGAAAEHALPDVVEAAAQATVRVMCIGGGGAPRARQPHDAPVARAGPFRREPGYDVVGFDYNVLRDATVAGCERACEVDGRCRAYTFNRRHAVCFLKDDAAILLRNADAVGGYRSALAGEVFRSSFTVTANADSPGGDYARLRDVGFLGCYLECEMDPVCRAFAYISARRDCWLKDRLGPLRLMQGVELGLR